MPKKKEETNNEVYGYWCNRASYVLTYLKLSFKLFHKMAQKKTQGKNNYNNFLNYLIKIQGNIFTI